MLQRQENTQTPRENEQVTRRPVYDLWFIYRADQTRAGREETLTSYGTSSRVSKITGNLMNIEGEREVNYNKKHNKREDQKEAGEEQSNLAEARNYTYGKRK